MKTSRLAAQANLCRVAHLRALTRLLTTATCRFIAAGRALKLTSLMAICATAGHVGAASVKLSWNANPESDISGYRLSYGTSSGSYSSTVETGNATTTTVSGLTEGQTYYFVLRAVNTSGLQSDPSAEISHTVAVSPLIASTGWRVVYADSQEAPAFAAAYAIDGNPATFWHTAWKNGTTPPPHEIQIDLGTVQPIAGFRYLPRQDAYNNGSIAQYEFYVSTDGANWGSPVATGTFADTKAEKEVLFPSTSCRFVRLRQITEVNGWNDCAVAELNFIRGQDTTVVAPVQPAENRAPVASAASVSTTEDKPLAITLNASDPDGGTLTYQIVRQPAIGTLSGSAPNLTYTPNSNINGSDSFTFRVSDGSLTSDTVTVAITISPVNDAPVAANQSVNTSAATPVTVRLAATDVDGDALTYQVASAPTKGTLSGTAPNLTYTPSQGASGADSFTFRASDGQLNSSNATVSINIQAATSGTLISRTGWRVHYVDSQDAPTYAAAFAIDGSPATFWHTAWRTGTTPPPHEIQIDLGTVQPIAGFRYLPRQDAYNNGNIAQFEFYVSTDGTNWGSPVATGTFADSKAEKEVTFTTTSGRFVRLRQITEVNGWNDCAVAELNLIQGEAAPALPPPNQAPVAAAASVTTDEDKALAITLSGSDPENAPLTWQIVSQPAMGTLSGSAPNLTYTPRADANGNDSFTFRVSDGSLTSASATVSITITPINDAPVAVARMVSTPADKPVAITLVATDKDGDPLTYRIISQPVKGTLSGTAPNLTYTPGQGVSGSDSLSFRVNDGKVNSSTATVSITLTAPLSNNLPPVFQTTRISRSSGTAGLGYSCTSLNGCATDPDGDLVAYEKAGGPDWLIVGTDGSVSGTPPESATGLNAFIIRARDPKGAYADALLEIEVQSVALPAPWAMQRLGTAGVESTAWGDTLSLTLTGSGLLAGKADSGLLTWQPLTGDGAITARITSLQGMDSTSRIGLMIRESLAADSKHTFIGTDGRGYVRWVRRTKTAASTSISTLSLTNPVNLWLRLTRAGNTVTAFTSSDGSAWTRVGSASIDLGVSSYIGLSVSSGTTAPGTAVFDNVTVNP